MKCAKSIQLATLLMMSASILAACGPNSRSSSASLSRRGHASREQIVRERLEYFARSSGGAYDPANEGNKEFASRIQAAGLKFQSVSHDGNGSTYHLRASFFLNGMSNELVGEQDLTFVKGTRAPAITELHSSNPRYRIEAFCTKEDCNNVVIRVLESAADPCAAASTTSADAAAASPTPAAKKQIVAIYASAQASGQTSEVRRATRQSRSATRRASAVAATNVTDSALESGAGEIVDMRLSWISSPTGDVATGGDIAKLTAEEVKRLANGFPTQAPLCSASGTTAENPADATAPASGEHAVPGDADQAQAQQAQAQGASGQAATEAGAAPEASAATANGAAANSAGANGAANTPASGAETAVTGADGQPVTGGGGESLSEQDNQPIPQGAAPAAGGTGATGPGQTVSPELMGH